VTWEWLLVLYVSSNCGKGKRVIDLILSATQTLITKGVEFFQKSEETKRLRLCVQDRLRRELRFNREILDELARMEEGKNRWDGRERRRLVKALNTAAIDAVDGGMIPSGLLVEGDLTPQSCEILDELARMKEGKNRWDGRERRRLVKALNTTAFDAVDGGMIPSGLLLEGDLQPQSFFMSWKGSEAPAAYTVRVREVRTQAQLVERTYHRIRLYKLYGNSPERETDVQYLCFLVAKTLEALGQGQSV